MYVLRVAMENFAVLKTYVTAWFGCLPVSIDGRQTQTDGHVTTLACYLLSSVAGRPVTGDPVAPLKGTLKLNEKCSMVLSGDRISVGAIFSAPVQTCPGAHPASYTMCAGFLLGVKRPERGVDHPPLLAPRLKEE